jgi:hypothetical protein
VWKEVIDPDLMKWNKRERRGMFILFHLKAKAALTDALQGNRRY